MKTIQKFSILLITTICMFSVCSKAQPSSTNQGKERSGKGSISKKKVLIVYLSRTKNTEAIAKIIQREVGGKLVALELKKPYPENYQAIVDQVAKENRGSYLPPLKKKIDSIAQYDIIFLGFPTWGMQLPPPMKSFLSSNNLKGKTLIPFNTNAGYGSGSTFQTVKDLAPNSNILEGFSTLGGKERDGIMFVIDGKKEKQAQLEVQKWLQKIRVKE